MLLLLFAVLLLWLLLIKARPQLAGLPLWLAGLLSATLALVNNISGHFFAPMGIILTPAVVISAAACVMLARGSRSFMKVLVLTAIIIGHDIGLKLYAGGRHDLEGLGWMTAFLFMGLLPAYGVLVFYVWKMKTEPRHRRVLSALLLPILLSAYLYFFGNLGLGRFY